MDETRTAAGTGSPAGSDPGPPTALQVLDWRRRTASLYAAVRAEAATDPRAAHGTWRRGREELLADHPASPLRPEHRDAFAGLAVAPYVPELRTSAALEPWEGAAGGTGSAFSYRTGTDGVVEFERAGTVELEGVGRLAVWWLAGYGGGLFLPLRDGGSGRLGYGGGRYVLDTVKGADLGSGPGGLVVDLNFAYPPSCAYDPAWACPLPPVENRTEAVVEAGELHRGPWADAGY